MNAPVYLALEKNEFDQAVFDSLSDNLKETIGKSPEYVDLHGGFKSENAYAKQKSKDTPQYDEMNPPPYGAADTQFNDVMPF